MQIECVGCGATADGYIDGECADCAEITARNALATEAIAAIERLVDAGRKATPGEWQWIGATLETDQATVVGLETKGVSWMEYQVIAMDNRDADQAFIVAAANARPALSALAGMCVLPAEVVRSLVAASGAALDDLGWEHCAQHGIGPAVVDSLAAAEAELRRVGA